MYEKNLQDPTSLMANKEGEDGVDKSEQKQKEKEDPLLDIEEGRRHKLFDNLENTDFFLIKAPTEDFFIKGVRD